MVDISTTFKKALSQLLSDNDMTQTHLAAKLSVSATAVNNWLVGNNMPRMEKIDAIAEIFGVNRSYLIGDRGNYAKIVGTEFEGDYSKAMSLVELNYDSIRYWINDKLQTSKDSILLAKHFSEILADYKELVEAYVYASVRWRTEKNELIKSYQLIDPKYTEEDIIKLFFAKELELNMENLVSRIKSLPTWRAIYYDDLSIYKSNNEGCSKQEKSAEAD